jgi:Tfp pilus assembly protein PilX
MRLCITARGQQLAHTLVTVLVISSILCISVLGYLSVVEQESVLSARSQGWNVAMAVVEAGVEDGLEHLNENYANLASDGWSGAAQVYTRSNTLTGGNSYAVEIYVTNALSPVVAARGYVRNWGFVRNETAYAFATVGGAAGGEVIARGVIVRCARGRRTRLSCCTKNNRHERQRPEHGQFRL